MQNIQKAGDFLAQFTMKSTLPKVKEKAQYEIEDK